MLRYPMVLAQEQINLLTDAITPTAEALGVEPLVLCGGADARLEYSSSALLERVCVALEEIAAQGRAPDVSEAQIAPQALNARTGREREENLANALAAYPQGLNTRG